MLSRVVRQREGSGRRTLAVGKMRTRILLLRRLLAAAGGASPGVGGNLAVKYIVGCQVDVGGVDLSVGGALEMGASTTVGLSGGLTLGLAPGQVAIVSVTDKDLSDSGVASVQLSQISFNLNNCGGFASARSAVKVIGAKGYSTDDGKLSGEGTLIQSTLYGKPFSIN